jgi:quercetin dioxygenase-like cupin family protein
MSESTLPRPPLAELPGECRPYVLEAGGGRGHLLIDQVGRCVAGAEETADAWSMMVLDGPRGGPIPLHHHQVEDEYFYCHRGQVQVWADDESRILQAGDFAHVPHGTVHAYQCHGHFSGFVGPILPAGWDRFFDFCGEPYAGSPFPVGIEPVIPFAKLGAASQKFGQTFLPQAEYAAPTSDAPDDALPGEQKPYFLRAGEGPRHLLGGQLQITVCGSAETGGTLAITTLEMGKGAAMPAHAHERTTEGLFVLDGRLRLRLDGDEYLLTRGDYASIPAGTEHAYESEAGYTKALAMSTPGGLERLFAMAGDEAPHRMFGRAPYAIDRDRLDQAARELDVVLAGG